MTDAIKRPLTAAAAWGIAVSPGVVLAATAADRAGVERGGGQRLPFVISPLASVVGCALLVRAAGAGSGVTRWFARAVLVAEAFVVGAQLFMRTAFQSDLDEVALLSVPTL